MKQNGLGIHLLLQPNGHEFVCFFYYSLDVSSSPFFLPPFSLSFLSENRFTNNQQSSPSDGWINQAQQQQQQPTPPNDWKAFYENLKSGPGGGILTSSQLKEDSNILSLSESGDMLFAPPTGGGMFLKSSEGNGGTFLEDEAR